MRYDRNSRTDLGKMLKSSEMRRVVEQAAEVGATAARVAVPRDSGSLAASIHVEFAGDSGGPKSDRVEAQVVADAPHAAAVQFGTKNRRAQPYLEAAIDAIEGGAG